MALFFISAGDLPSQKTHLGLFHNSEAPSLYAKPKRDHLFMFVRDVLRWGFLKCGCGMVSSENVAWGPVS